MSEVKQLTEEELKALTVALQAVLEKHGAEIGVTSTINLMKRVEEVKTTKDDGDKKEEDTNA